MEGGHMKTSGGGVFQAAGIACAKGLGQKHARVYMEEVRGRGHVT